MVQDLGIREWRRYGKGEEEKEDEGNAKVNHFIQRVTISWTPVPENEGCGVCTAVGAAEEETETGAGKMAKGRRIGIYDRSRLLYIYYYIIGREEKLSEILRVQVGHEFDFDINFIWRHIVYYGKIFKQFRRSLAVGSNLSALDRKS